jgi:pimeloyl-ACP methyl ester carboxylesterase
MRTWKSTIVRTGFRSLERVAPGVGARWAERLWFTLPPRRPARPFERGTAFSVDVDGHRVVGDTWGEGPAVYLVHGWAGDRGQLTAFVAPLVSAGYRVVAFDAPSHGESAPGEFGPRSSTIPEFAAALEAVVARHGQPRAIVAHSLGAASAAVALCDGMRASRVVLIAPTAGVPAFERSFAAALGYGERTRRRLFDRTERRVGAPMHHFDVPALGRAVLMPKTLIVHDRDDAVTPVADGEAIAEAWSGSRLHLTSGLGHRRLLRDPAVIAEVVDFVTA